MSRYYFNLKDQDTVVLDHEGQVFPDRQSMELAAMSTARSLVSHEVLEGVLRLKQQIEVVDTTGATVHRLRFADVLKIDLLEEA